MAIPGWQTQIRLSLIERNRLEQSQSEMIEHSRRLNEQLIVWKERNRTLLAGSNGWSSNRGEKGVGGSKGDGNQSVASGGSNDSVRLALIQSLEAELSTLRQDLSEQYKQQSHNAQRLLGLTDQLREAEERGREEREELRSLRHEVEGLRDKQRSFREIVADKEKQIVILQDDHTSLSLELNQQDLLISRLKEDNKNLLDRWLEAKREEAERMNEANEWVSQARRLKVGDDPEKGKEEEAEVRID
ncbi:Atg16p [Sporobolomyces salmoneus]|uniref:Atg16p n=1 Tax=Sporobolomyces salmoneus TaxID=183962 RepID=UPI00316E768F